MKEFHGSLVASSRASKITFVALLVLFSLNAFGQTFGEVTGRVSDPSGAGVPNSVLTLTSTATNAARKTDSGSDGFYSFPSVPPGIYNLKSEHPGFKTVTTDRNGRNHSCSENPSTKKVSGLHGMLLPPSNTLCSLRPAASTRSTLCLVGSSA